MGSKSLTVAQHLVLKAKKPMSPMKLLKLCYIAHGYMLARHRLPLLDEQVQAWQYGPIVESVYQSIRDYGSRPVTTVHGNIIWVLDFTEDEEAVMQEVLDKYEHVDAITLSAAMHKAGTPWEVSWSLKEENTSMSNELIAYHYGNVVSQPSHSTL
jgi:uncharacterized phage-associated protein